MADADVERQAIFRQQPQARQEIGSDEKIRARFRLQQPPHALQSRIRADQPVQVRAQRRAVFDGRPGDHPGHPLRELGYPFGLHQAVGRRDVHLNIHDVFDLESVRCVKKIA